MQFYKLNKIGESKTKPADFYILPAQVPSSHKFEHFKHAHTPYMQKLATRKVFYHI